MELGLEGKVAFITGASEGIGYAAAESFAREGAKVGICARRPEPLNEAAQRLRATGGDIYAAPADVTDPSALEAAAGGCVHALGPIDILVNNAGGAHRSELLAVTDEEWQYSWDMMLMAAVRLCRHVIPGMRERRWGRIINVSSIYGRQPGPEVHDYNVVKAALINLTKCLANEYAADNVLANIICPGPILTPLWVRKATGLAREQGTTMETVIEQLAERNVPLGRYGKPEEVADFIVFLASERASFTTGASFNVDGGMVRGMP